MPESAEVHLVGLYKGNKELDIQLGQSGHTTTEVEVVVDHTPNPVILVLTAYDPVVWKVRFTPRAKIAGVLVSGALTQALLGIPKSLPHRVISGEQSTGCDYFYVSRESDVPQIQSKVAILVGKNVHQYYGGSASGTFQIGGDPYVQPADAVSSDELSLGDYPVFKGEIPAGRKGIDQLQREQKIRLAKAEDVASWNGDKEKKARLEIGLRIGNVYVVNEQITLPPGLFGAQRCDFIIPANVSKPLGPKSHCDFYYLKDNSSQ